MIPGNQEFAGKSFVAPLLTEDDAFLSQTLLGFFVYRMPAVHDLMQVPQSAISHFESMWFTIEVQVLGHASDSRW
jgi:hypothetical protein